MNWKFWERPAQEQRSQPYTDAIVTLLESLSTDNSLIDERTATEEACAGLWSRAFASADVSPDTAATRALSPGILALMGRELFDQGQSVFEIQVRGGDVVLAPVSSWNVTGGDMWDYELTVAQPSSIVTRYRPSDAVVHVQYARDSARPWTAAGPIQRSSATRKLAANLEGRMAQEAGMPTGNVIPVPDTTGTEALQADIKGIKGNNVLVPSGLTGDWPESGQQGGNSRSDWMPRRLGANFPESMEPIRQGVSDHLAAAGGVPASLIRGDSEGTGRREGWRQFLHATIGPVSKIIIAELRIKLDTPDLTLSFDSLMASDLSGRARAFQSMVGGGLDVTKAAQLSGLMEGE